MKNYFIYLLIVLFTGITNLLIAQEKDQSQVRLSLKKTKTQHSSDLYHLTEIKGIDKAELNLYAMEYSEYNIPNKQICMQFELYTKNNSGCGSSKAKKITYAYVDEQEYPEVIVVITNLLSDLANKHKSEKQGSFSYTTNDGIKFGFLLTPQKACAFIEISENNTISRIEFSNPSKFYNELNKMFDIATKKLYLPANAQKLKNVKKQKGDNSKEIIIDDI